MHSHSQGVFSIASAPPSARLALHRAGHRWIAIAPKGLVERRPEKLELSPNPRSPIVWRFRDGDLRGRLLNVVGWLEGGLVSVSTAGTMYVRTVGNETQALYLPGHAVHVELGPKPPRILAAGRRNTPLFPDTWPPNAVRQVIRRRLRTIIVLAEQTLLAEFDGKTAH